VQVHVETYREGIVTIILALVNVCAAGSRSCTFQVLTPYIHSCIDRCTVQCCRSFASKRIASKLCFDVATTLHQNLTLLEPKFDPDAP